MSRDEQEWKTRLDRINVKLGKAGWNVKNRTKVLEEVDTKNSVFPHDIKHLKDWAKKENLDAPGIHCYSHEKYGVNKELVEKTFQFYDHFQYMDN